MKNTTLFLLGIAMLLSSASLAQTAPRVLSINRQSPTVQTTNATSVTFRVTFSEKVSGVSASDFLITALSGNVRGTLETLAPETSGTAGTDAVVKVGTSGAVYDVSVRAIGGSGTLRLDLESSGTGIENSNDVNISGGFTAGQTYFIQPSGLGFASFSDLSPLPISSQTAEKPQAKVWHYAGKWWAVLPTSGGTKIFRLDGTSWTPVLPLVSNTNCKADCQVVGNVVHILLFRGGGNSSYLVSAEYDLASGSYKLWSRRTGKVSLDFESGTETATIALDSTGRMWVAWDKSSTVNVKWSNAPYSSWSSTITIASGIKDDDICAIAALPGKIGVLWSNQNTKRFGFRTHANGDSPSAWSDDEVPASQSALDIRYGMADDHMNILAGSDGTLYCAVKTGYDTPKYPKVSLLVRRPSGTWDNLYPVTANEGTRPIVLLNEALGKIKVVYSSAENGGEILYRESALSPISFGPPITLMAGNCEINYVTSTHQTYTSEIVVMATNMDTSPKLAVSVLATDNAAPVASAAAPGAPAAGETAFPADAASAGTKLLVASNPFRNHTVLTYTLAEGSPYTLTLYDAQGAALSLLRQGTAEAGKPYMVTVDGSNLARGVYFARLQTPAGSKTLKLVLDK